ncbi:YfjI family protein [Ferrovum sp.]|uniref:YfjI family protein n=1 Tax=Ferrovum sp. TaxID=2609467 RepID=UPI00260D733D|nr:YfjI family protein [Ferrovum sp.]
MDNLTLEQRNVLDYSRPAPANILDTMRSASESLRSEPEPLRATLSPAEPYPVDALGNVLGTAAKAIHESVKAPLALCCQSVLAAASLAAQAHFDVLLPWGERKPLSLFLLTVGESGERKTGVDDLVLGAAKVQERAAMEGYAEDLKLYQEELASWNQATEAARKAVTNGKKGTVTAREVQVAVGRCGDKPEAPIVPLRFMTDPTVEGMYKQLVQGQPSVALFSDEGGLLIGGHALNSDNALKTMARWCKLWDGSPFDRVRAGDGAGVLYGRRMAFHQLAQPDVMATLLSDRMANGQGLLARCLVAWPDSTIGTRHIKAYEWPGNHPALKRLFAVFKGLMEAKPRSGKSEQELDPVELPLTDDAKSLAVAANNQFETLMAPGAELAELRDRTSKAVENACRIAGVLAVIEQGLSVREIGEDHLGRALVLVQWYLKETLRIKTMAQVPAEITDAEALMRWLQGRNMRQFCSVQVMQGGPNRLRSKSTFEAAIKVLGEGGYVGRLPDGQVIDGKSRRLSWEVFHYVV